MENEDPHRDNAPPVAFNQIKGNINDNNINDKLEESSYNLFSSFPNNNIINNPNNINQSQINSFQLNENKIPQNINNPINIPIYQYYNMMNLNRLNYLNQINYLNNQILLNKLNYFNQGNSINNNINKINSDALDDYNFMIDIPELLLEKIEKKYLIDLILFIKKYCNLKIIDKYIKYNHDFYEIRIYKNNQCKINIKDFEKKKLENIEKEEEDIKNKNEIIINENHKNEIKELKNENLINSSSEEYNDDIIIISSKNKLFRCINHNKIFQNKEAIMNHCRETHKFRCGECGQFFGIKRKMNEHLRQCKNTELKRNRIKCSECDLFFDDEESMSIHFYEMHDKKTKIEQKRKIFLQKLN